MLIKYLGPAILGLSLLSWSYNNFDSVPVVYDSKTVFDAAPKMVMIVSFDNLRPDAIAPTRAEHIQSIAQAGVSASAVRTMVPAVSLPHLIEEARKQGVRTATVEAGSPAVLASEAIGVIHDQHPQLIFVHFASPKKVGESEAIDEADQGLGQILQSLKSQNLLASTAVIVTSGHGEPGNLSEKAAVTPWLAVGAGVGPHRTIASTVSTYDTAATAAKLLSVPVPTNWNGKTVF